MATKTKKAPLANFTTLKVGEILSETQFYKVEKIKDNKCQLITDRGERVVLDKDYVENCLVSSIQYTDTKTINKTEAAELVLSNANTAMTINFNKQVKESDVVKEIMDAYEGSTSRTMESAIKRAIKASINGIERTIRGRHSGNLDSFGRISFIDMELDKDDTKDFDVRSRLVDTRNINWIIVNGTKYTVK